ncbi:MAG: TIGR00725 family protein [Sulfurovaceae bacterium]|nr:TIGR00725 family protein [Sulfurovaceae bacterium]
MYKQQISIIGNAGSIKDEYTKKITQNIGQLIAELNFNLICGGLGGVMEMACKGFKSIDGNGRTIGILPSYDKNTVNEFIDIPIPTGLDIGRNQLVVASGFAVIVIGGGAGTLSEIALASQIGKPILLIKKTGGWADKLKDNYLDERENSPLYHINSLKELKIKLLSLVNKKDRSGTINSLHHR